MKYSPTIPLSQLTELDLTPSLAKRGREMPDHLAKDRIETALHEAAHLVAALSCRSYIRYVEVSVDLKKPKRGAYGCVNSIDILPVHECFISAAGPAWDSLNHYPEEGPWWKRCEPDLIRGLYESIPANRDFMGMFRLAQQYVFDSEPVIKCAAAALLEHAPLNGMLKDKPLSRLTAWLRPQVQPFPEQEILRIPPPDLTPP